MGVSLEQYRAAIGLYAAGRPRKSSPSVSEEDCDTSKPQMEAQWTLNGPWKLHATILAILLLQLLICPLIISAPGYPPALPQKTQNLPDLLNASDWYHTSVVTTCTDMHGLDDLQSLIPAQCCKMLLIIGGIEQNPGPSTPQNMDQEFAEEDSILADLCARAPSDEARNSLRHYDPRLEHQALEKQINKLTKDQLLTGLKYLGKEDMEGYTKPTCITAFICRIQNLFPDECNLCKEQYCIRLSDTPLLSCAKCGQGTHNSCILKLLNIPKTDWDSVTEADAWNQINPTKFPGLTYLCKPCTEAIIPSEEDGKKKKKTKSVIETPQEVVAETEITDDSKEVVVPPEVAPISSGAQQHEVIPQEPQQPVNEGPQNAENQPQNGTLQNVTPKNVTPQNLVVDDHPKHEETTKEICYFYKKGTCRYGRSGRQCRNEHPPVCDKLNKYGNKGANGCTLGKNCPSFHPKMCPLSLSKGECLKPDCTLRHIRGTKRINSKENSAAREIPKGDLNTRPHTTPQRDYFLDAFREMQVEIQKLTACITRPVMPPLAAPVPQPQWPPVMPQTYAMPWQMPYWNQMTTPAQPTVWPDVSPQHPMHPMMQAGLAAMGQPIGGNVSTHHPLGRVPMPQAF